MAMAYGTIYVAKIAIGANPNQTVKAFMEAEAYDGPSLIIAYAHCIAHGINMRLGLDEQKKAVASGYWPLFRYNPAVAMEGKNPLQLDSKEPTISFADYAENENRYMSLKQTNPDSADQLMKLADSDVRHRFKLYQQLASIEMNCNGS